MILGVAVGASAFAPVPIASRVATRAAKASVVVPQAAPMSVMEKGMKEWEAEYPLFAKYGWGPTAKAERWNGRHAMFGWMMIILTGYAQNNHLIPNPQGLLEWKEWGSLAYLYAPNTITNERAIILVANVHALVVSTIAFVAPFDWQDKLLLDEGEAPEEPTGVVPAFQTGLTSAAEMWNGRVAMFGLVVTAIGAMSSGKSFLEVVDWGLGGLLLPNAGAVVAAATEVAAAAAN